MSSLSDYLKKRGLQLEPMSIDGLVRPYSDEELAKVADISEEALILLIQPRIDAIAKELIEKAIPEETLVLRQAFIEIGGLIDDYRKSKLERERRREEKPKEAQPSPPVEEGKEGSL